MSLSDAESCRNGLAYAIGMENRFSTHLGTRANLTKQENSFLQREFNILVRSMESTNEKTNVWNIETSLCAYKKYRLGKRFIGYYIDRQHDEIEKMEKSVSDGVDWEVLWDYRKEKFDKDFLKEAV